MLKKDLKIEKISNKIFRINIKLVFYRIDTIILKIVNA